MIEFAQEKKMDNPYADNETFGFGSIEQERILDAQNDDNLLGTLRDKLHDVISYAQMLQKNDALAVTHLLRGHANKRLENTLEIIIDQLDDALYLTAEHQDLARQFLHQNQATPNKCPNCGHQMSREQTLPLSATHNDPAKADGEAGSPDLIARIASNIYGDDDQRTIADDIVDTVQNFLTEVEPKNA